MDRFDLPNLPVVHRHQIEGQYYRQVVGIPQGSVLSSLLCSFAYGDLERRKFKFSQDQESVSILRNLRSQRISIVLGASETGGRLPAHHDELFKGEVFP